MLSQSIKCAFKASIPAMVGYLTLGFAFGLLMQRAGAVWFIAPIMSLMVYAGAAQFIAIAILAAHGTIWQIASATFFVNLRYIFYGLSFVGKFNGPFLQKAYMIFGLTDEAYSILTTSKQNQDKNHYFWVIACAHIYWVTGTMIGSVIGSKIPFDFSFLKFSLIALFVVLAIEQAYALKKAMPFIVAVVSSIVALIWMPQHMLLVAMLLVSVSLVFIYQFKEIIT